MRFVSWLGAMLVLVSLGLGCSDSRRPAVFVERFLQSDVRVDTDLPGAGHSAKLRACSEGRNVWVVWADDRNGATDIYFNRSSDGGETWLASDVRLDTDGAGAAASDDPQICCAGGRLYVAWEDARNGSKDIYFNYSADGGDTWLPADVRIDADVAGAAQSGDPLVGCGGGRVHVVWEEERSGERDVYVRSSADNGATWTAEALVNTNGAGASLSDRPRVSVDGLNVYVVWHDDRNGANNDIYFNMSLDGGATWEASDTRLDTDAPSAGFSFDPEVHACGQTVLVAWADLRDGAADIYYSRSSDGGRTWLASDVRLDTDAAGAGASIRPQVRCEGNQMYVAWIDQRSGAGDVYVNHSSDGGETWQATDTRVDTDPGAGSTDFVQMSSSGVNVYLAWEDNRDGQRDIRMTYSTDRGETWAEADVRCDTSPVGSSESRLPRITADGPRVYILWRDARNGANNDIYCNGSTPD